MRPTLPRALAATVLGMLGWYTFVVGPQLASPGAPESRFVYERPPPQQMAQLAQFPAAGHTFIGVQTDAGTKDFAGAERFATATGTRPSVYEFSAGWAIDEFSPEPITRVAARGMLPMVSWEPWDFRTQGPSDHGRADQPAWRLAEITGGAYDDYVRSWARGIADLSYPVAVRLGHEMNGTWYPWAERVNGNRPGDFVRMWHHVHDLFDAAGARNVIWVWSPNVGYAGSQPLDTLYPGDAYVDWVGLSGYYGTGGQRAYRPFDQIFGETLRSVAGISARPVVIAETGATDVIGRRADWIRDMFRSLDRHPEVIGVIWFEVGGEVDWRIAGAPDAAGAFRAGAAAPRYDAPWTPYTRPLTTVAARR
ncbi:glycosyl hydrolase [Pseudonocardia sp. 73-21]|uniref:glycoside hydrolase family 26 protein n=1 Tax=Pseudonocardia sp. 73-21 TaxID=1895809 RepID=UPI00096381EB|nr:glycosyl hydrolase [Pseudonocardia sp. 73-21]OJY39083.1 MAG: beta-mannanase [Pseudonocardia sp. 73-21]